MSARQGDAAQRAAKGKRAREVDLGADGPVDYATAVGAVTAAQAPNKRAAVSFIPPVQVAPGPSEPTSVFDTAVKANQQMFVRYGTADTTRTRQWEAAKDLQAPGESSWTAMKLEITHAPSEFSRPTTVRQEFVVPFSVKLTLRHVGPVDVEQQVRAYCLNEQQLEGLVQWSPSTARQGDDIANDMASGRIVSRTRSGASASTSVQIDFKKMSFKTSSRMAPRFLLFVWTAPSRESFLYALYSVPTMVLSRKVDQLNRAARILQSRDTMQGGPRAAATVNAQAVAVEHVPAPAMASGGGFGEGAEAAAPPAHGVSASQSPTTMQVPVTGVTQSSSVVATMKSGLIMQRELCQLNKAQGQAELVSACAESRNIYSRAGFQRCLNDFSVDGLEITASGMESIDAYKAWFDSALALLQSHARMWEVKEPLLLCGFEMTRRLSEHVLKHEPPGTFIVRLASEPGAFCISGRVKPGDCSDLYPNQTISHMIIDRHDVQQRSLEIWVRDTHWAQSLLDPYTGQRVLKPLLFLPRYSRLASG